MSAEASPRASVVVATHNRSHLLPRLLEKLEGQRDVADWELVVVNDGSTDDTASRLEKLGTTYPRMRVINLATNGGPARARNIGWQAARGDIVAFTDDDCVASPRWLASLLESIESGADLAQGRIEPDAEDHASIGAFGRTIELVNGLNPYFATCNMAYRRAWLERLGGFDEDFPHPWCEDTDLGQRAIREGARLIYNDDALVVHDVVQQSWWSHLKGRRRKVSDARLVSKHPHMRATLGGLDAHTPALVSLVGLVLMLLPVRLLRWAVGPMLVVVYVRHHVRRRRRPEGLTRWRWVAAMPGYWAADVYEAIRFERATRSPRRSR